MVLPLRTEMEIESSPSPASTKLLASVRAATTVSLPPAAQQLHWLHLWRDDRESAPSAKVTLTSVTPVELKTTVSFEVSLKFAPEPCDRSINDNIAEGHEVSATSADQG